MHELGSLIRELMDQESMTQADLVRRSGLTPQHVSTMLKGETMSRLPEAKTFEGLCQAFPTVPPSVFVLAAAAAVGLPVETEAPDYSQLSNEALLGILHNRLEGGQQDGGTPEAQKMMFKATTRDDVTTAARLDPDNPKTYHR